MLAPGVVLSFVMFGGTILVLTCLIIKEVRDLITPFGIKRATAILVVLFWCWPLLFGHVYWEAWQEKRNERRRK